VNDVNVIIAAEPETVRGPVSAEVREILEEVRRNEQEAACVAALGRRGLRLFKRTDDRHTAAQWLEIHAMDATAKSTLRLLARLDELPPSQVFALTCIVSTSDFAFTYVESVMRERSRESDHMIRCGLIELIKDFAHMPSRPGPV